ncbi:YbaB/EbfC DNA-binding family protein [Asanoa hainanensis]|uniref:YbaB/EbfC DNA-binding family protein n=1 Tax=Asanoa hainanensis TaxID=560556 RepID=A0A239PGD9_9ACTN|nr:YbaB/EbfC family nucleoid-associated protein [Asanoa hainanensis]SNT66133.1 YbaB/EbfC DNA-binding family protein [Asanoa hainanensis]
MSAFDAIPKPMPPAELKDAVDALRQAVTAATATVSTPDGAVEVTAGPGNSIVGLGFGRAAYRYSPERLGALVVDTAREATAQATGSMAEAVRTVRHGRAELPGLLGGTLPEVPTFDPPNFDDVPGDGPRNGTGTAPGNAWGNGLGDGPRDETAGGPGNGPANAWGNGLDNALGNARGDGPSNGPGNAWGNAAGEARGDSPSTARGNGQDNARRNGAGKRPADGEFQHADQVLRRVSEDSQRQLAGYAELRTELADLTATARSADGGVSAQVRAGGELLAVHISNGQLRHDPATLAGIVHTTVMTASARAAMLMAERVQQLTGPRLDIRSLVESYQTPDDDPHRS